MDILCAGGRAAGAEMEERLREGRGSAMVVLVVLTAAGDIRRGNAVVLLLLVVVLLVIGGDGSGVRSGEGVGSHDL